MVGRICFSAGWVKQEPHCSRLVPDWEADLDSLKGFEPLGRIGVSGMELFCYNRAQNSVCALYGLRAIHGVLKGSSRFREIES
jgi:hypothetical protein